jgi:hypothetical protein
MCKIWRYPSSNVHEVERSIDVFQDLGIPTSWVAPKIPASAGLGGKFVSLAIKRQAKTTTRRVPNVHASEPRLNETKIPFRVNTTPQVATYSCSRHPGSPNTRRAQPRNRVCLDSSPLPPPHHLTASTQPIALALVPGTHSTGRSDYSCHNGLALRLLVSLSARKEAWHHDGLTPRAGRCSHSGFLDLSSILHRAHRYPGPVVRGVKSGVSKLVLFHKSRCI